MKQFSIVVGGLAIAALLCAQDKPPAAADAAGAKQENYEAAIIPVKTLTGDSFDRLSKLLGVFNVRFVADEKLRTIVVYAPKDVVEKMRKVVEQLDQPGSEAAIGRNIDMALAFLRCSHKGAGADISVAGRPRTCGAATTSRDAVQGCRVVGHAALAPSGGQGHDRVPALAEHFG